MKSLYNLLTGNYPPEEQKLSESAQKTNQNQLNNTLGSGNACEESMMHSFKSFDSLSSDKEQEF